MDNKLKNTSIIAGVLLIAIIIVWFMFSSSNNQTITGAIISDNQISDNQISNNQEINEDNAIAEIQTETAVPAVITEENIVNDSNNYANPSEGDMFSNTAELHWTHMPLTYNFYNCSQTEIDKITKATDFITNRTESITFKSEDVETPDISFICVNNRKMEYTNKYVINTFAEAVPYVYTDFNIYAPSQVLIYSINSCPYGRPTTEIHEILHLLGLEHPNYAYDDDIMNPEHVGCTTDITEENLKYLKNIYG